jgi:Cu(I)/Ag(I) efflux system membrane fusion protein
MRFTSRQALFLGFAIGLAVAILGGVLLWHMQRAAPKATLAQSANAAEAVHPAEAQSGADTGTQPGATVELSDSEQNAAGIQLAEARRQPLVTEVSAFGRVEQPESQLSTISARVSGRIDKLYLQYTGQNVQRGQMIAEIFSNDLLTASEEYRLALESRKQLNAAAEPDAIRAADDLVSASRHRLELWGLTPTQIEHIASGRNNPDVAIYSTTSGTVVERKVTQGQYVNAGDVLYSVADFSTVWVKADVYEADLPQIRSRQPVEITSDALSGRKIHGHVEFIEPQAINETRTIPVHIHVANPGMQLRPGMFVRAMFAVHQENALTLPRSAVLDTGTRKLVYVAKANGLFEAREVQTGAPNNDVFPITSGLKPGERVVINGNFLIDSQTRLSGGMSGLFGGSKEFAGNEAHGGGSPEPQSTSPTTTKLSYRTEPDPVKGATQVKFLVLLSDAAGKPINDAQVKVTFVMPAMPAMNMPEMRTKGDLSWTGKEYGGTIDVPMAGFWNVTIEATRNGAVLASQHSRITAH